MVRSVSPLASQTLKLLANSIKTHRVRRGWSIEELAQRVGVSHPTIIKVERGAPSVAIGTVLEAAALVGVPLYDEDPDVRARYEERLRTELKLLPQAARRKRNEADDDF